jgi:hypothetical protein
VLAGKKPEATRKQVRTSKLSHVCIETRRQPDNFSHFGGVLRFVRRVVKRGCYPEGGELRVLHPSNNWEELTGNVAKPCQDHCVQPKSVIETLRKLLEPD